MKSSYRVIAFLVCVSLILCGTAFAQSPEVDAGLGYLVATQNGDGSWGTTPTATTTDFIATSSALSALAAWGYTQAASYQNGLAWLSTECASDDSTSHISATYLAQGIEVLATSGADTSFYVTSLLDMGTGTAWGGYAEYDPSPYHTALAMFALRSAGYEDATLLSYNLGYVLAGQGADGGWGWSAGDETSSALVTAYVLRALSPYAYTYTEVATSVGKSVAYLLSHQNADGGFGSSPSTVPETALGLISISSLTADATVRGGALEYLESTQDVDGSWADDPYQAGLALQALLIGADDSTPIAPATGTVSGAVVDASSHAPLGAVFVALASDPAVSVTTAADGSFTLTELEAGAVTLELSAAGYASATVEVSVTAGGIRDIGTVALSVNLTTGIVAGTVMDKATGAALVGATVTVTGSSIAEATTGADGTYRIADVTPGTMTITAAADGYYPASGTGTISAGGMLVFSPSLSVEPTPVTSGTLSGTVVTASGQPISSATISLAGWGGTTSSGSGRFEMADVGFGTYAVSITATGYVSQSYTIVLADDFEMGSILLAEDVSDETSLTIVGTVSANDTGEPIEGANITVSGSNLTTVTDAYGRFELGGVEPLSASVQISAVGYDSITADIEAGGYGTISISLTLNPSGQGNISIDLLVADKALYGSYESVNATLTLLNNGDADEVVAVTGMVQDMSGEAVAMMGGSSSAVSIPAGGTSSVVLTWSTVQMPAGRYSLMANVKELADTECTSNSGTETMLAERSAVVEIGEESRMTGAIAADPPITLVDLGEMVKLTASLRNNGNVALLASNAMVTVSLGEEVVLEDTVAIEALDVNEIYSINLGTFLPVEGGTYLVELKSDLEQTELSLTMNYLVGAHVLGEFTVSPAEVSPGSSRVSARIDLTGVGLYEGATQDPMVALIEDAMQKGVDYEEETVMTWNSTYNCNGCHLQAQAVLGLANSKKYVDVDGVVLQTLRDLFESWQQGDGSIYAFYRIRSATILGFWALSYWDDADEVYDILRGAATYLLTQQSANGAWLRDGGWEAHGWYDGTFMLTAMATVGMARAYEVTGDERFRDSVAIAADYLLNPANIDTGSNTLRASVIYGLSAAKTVITDEATREAIDARIEEVVGILSPLQSGGGWPLYGGSPGSPDSMVTAQVLYSLVLAGVSGDDPMLRDAITFLLNNQNPDGSWKTELMDTNMSTTSWVLISLPLALKTVRGIDVSVDIDFSVDVALVGSEPAASAEVGQSHQWKVNDVDEAGATIDLTLDVSGVELGEDIFLASKAIVSFSDSASGALYEFPLDIPFVRGTPEVLLGAEIDKDAYEADEDVQVTSTLRNSLSKPADAVIAISIEDEYGNVATTVSSDTLSLEAGVLAHWAYRVPVELLTDHDAKDVIAQTVIDLRDMQEQLGLEYRGIDENSFRVLEFDESGEYLGEKKLKAEFVSDEEVRIRFLANGQTYAGVARLFYVYYDTPENGPKTASTIGEPGSDERYILLSEPSGRISYIVNNQDGTFGSPEFLMDVSPSYDYMYSFGAGDLNGDGAFDLVAGSRSTQTAYAFIQNGSTFGEFEPVTLGYYTGTHIFAYAEVTDLNNDGFADTIYSGYYSDYLHISLGHGDGTFETPTVERFPEYSIYGFDARDVNSDGNSDLVIGSKGIYMKTGKGDGTFNPISKIYTIWDTFVDIEIADINSDGRNDILAVKQSNIGYNKVGFSLYVLYGNGMGGFGTPILMDKVENSYRVETSDVNDDGKIDLLVGNLDTYALDLYLGNGDGSFGERTEIAKAYFPITGIRCYEGAVMYPVTVGSPEYMPVTHSVTWNTGGLLAGSYYAHVSVSTEDSLMEETFLPFTILADTALDAQVAADRTSYAPGEAVEVKTRVIGESRNAMLEGLTTTTVVEGPTGEVVTDEAGTISLLAPGQVVDQASYWQTSGAAPGIYTARFTVLDGSAELGSDETTFEVLGTAVTGEGLTGTLALDPARVSPGEEASYAATVTNAGNEDVAAATVSVLLVDPASGAALQTYEQLQDLATGATVSVSGALSTAGLTINEMYLVVLRVSTTSMSEAKTLASATLAIVDTTPPVVTLTAPVSGSLWNGPVALKALATDDASGVNSVEYRIDSGTWTSMSDSGVGYAATWTPTAPDEGSRTISVRATDNAGNASEPVSVSVTIDLTPPSPPVITSPAEGSVLVVRDLTIEGTAEVGAWVTLKGPSLTTTIMNDGFEDFAFEGIALDPGENMFRFTATDVAGNVSEEAVLTISYVPIEMSIEMPADLTNVLLWINTGCTSSADKGCANLATVLAVAEELFDGARIVYDKKDFQSELGNPYYTDFVILGAREPMEDHYAAKLRERVYAGAGLVSSLFTREVLDESAFGIKQAGRLAGSAFTVSLGGDAPAWSGAYAVAGDALKVASEGATEAGWFELVSKKGEVEYAPAVLANGYGIGRAMVFAFAVEEQSAETMRDLLGQAVGYVHRTPAEGEAQPSSGMTAIRASLTTEGGEIGVRYTLEFPEGLALYDALAGAWVEESPYTLDATIEKDAPAEAVLYVLTPEAGGTYTVTSSVGYVEGDTYTEVATDERDVTVVDRATLLGWALDGLSTLAVSTDEIDWVAEAVATLDGVRLRGDATPEARDEDARDVLHAVEMTRKVTSADTSNALLLMDALLRSYAGAEYYGQ